MNSNYKINIKDIQDKYTFKIFCAGADTTEIEQEIEELDTRLDTVEGNITTLQSGKEDKSNKVTTLSNTSTDTQYPSAKCVYDSQTLQDATIEENTTNIEELKTYYESIYNALPKVSGTGESITLNDTAESVMKNKLYPQIKQDSTTGKNLLDVPSSLSVTTRTTINVVIPAGTYVVNASSVALGGPTDARIRFVANSSTIGTADLNTTTLSRNVTITEATDKIEVYSQNNAPNSEGVTTIFTNLMISTSGGEYEPYTGGSPSPSPSYPQPIHTISGDNTFTIGGNNLFDKSSATLISKTYESSTRWGYKLPKLNNDFYISKTIDDSKYYVVVEDVNGTLTFRKSATLTPTQVTNSDNDFYLLCTSTTSQSTAQGYYDNNNFMLSYTNDTYEPYQSQGKPLNLGELEYNAIGDYKDEFVKVDGEWFLRKNIGKYTFDGTEYWDISSGGTNSWSFDGLSTNYITDKKQVMSNIFRGVSNNEKGTAGDNIMYFGSNTRLYIRNTTYTTKEQVQSATNGNYAYYYMATPQTITLSTTLQNQIEDLYNATMSYKGQTNISQVNNDLAFVVEASALKDMSNDA